MTSLSEIRFGTRERKLLAVGILVLVVVLAYLAIVAPIVRGFAERRDERETQLLRYQRNERLIASVPRLRRVVEQQAPQRRRFVLEASDQAEARDYLQERLRSVLAGVGTDLANAEAVEGEQGAVAISGTARMSYPQLLHLMQKIQNDEPFVLLDGITVVANQALASGQLDTMDVKIDISIPYSPAAQH